ncbi:MAG TPA: RIP metalloprotease [Acidimicrobiales bacterium]|nr:RIP metalloprotease [Acidimicrobiales bacterium]
MTDTVHGGDSTAEDEPGAAAKKLPPTPAEQRSALVRLLVVLAAAAMASIVTGTSKTVLVVVAVLTMIMLHELGHYLTAKWGGMKVSEFFVGFGPRLWSIRKGETEYGVKAIPVGGYVKILGMHNLDPIDDPADEPRTYRQQPFGRRLSVAVAGSTMHFLIAFVLFFIVNAVVGVPTVSTTIGGLVKIEGGPSPAEEAGLHVGDRIVALDGKRLAEWDDVRAYISARPADSIAMTIVRDGRTIELDATPTDLSAVRIDGEPISNESRGFLGLEPKEVFETTNPMTAVGRSAKQWVGGSFDGPEGVSPGIIDNAKALGGILSPSGMASYWKTITGKDQAGRADGGARFLSPVGFVRLGGQAADDSLYSVIALLIAINLFVGLFNLLPLLPLDGGHVAIATYEGVRSKLAGRRYVADVAKLMPLTYAVVLLMVFLGVTALYLDIVRPLNFN